jgi:serine/threonine protein kinase
LATMFGRFELLDRIGIGGMAEVWRARVAGVGGFEKILVVKKILPAFAQNKTFIDMLLAEARLCAVLQHTNIVQTYENGEIDGHYYIGMEYVAGPDLFKVLSRATQAGMRIPQELCLFVAAEVAKGLHYAHNARDHYGRPLHIIHRDVSPSNVIVSEAGEVKVMDFGVARATPGGQPSDSATRSGVLKGKLGYMSPEQVTGQPFDHRSDIFSLGIILYESLTLKRLFLAKTDLETLVNIRDARIEHKFKKHAYIDEGVRNILRRSLARDVSERYPTAMAMHDDIVKLLFEGKQQVSNTMLANFLTQLFDPGVLTPKPPPVLERLDSPPTRPQRVLAPGTPATGQHQLVPSSQPAYVPGSQANYAPASQTNYVPSSASLSFSPDDMKKIRDKIAEKRSEPAPEASQRTPAQGVSLQGQRTPGPGTLTPPGLTGQGPTTGQMRTLPEPPTLTVPNRPSRPGMPEVRGTVPLPRVGTGPHAPASSLTTDGEIEVDGFGPKSPGQASGLGFEGLAREPASYTVAALAKATPAPTFRLRTGDGQEFGPLDQGNLEAMLRSRTASADDFVSVNDGPFQAIRSVSRLQPVVRQVAAGPGTPTLQGPLTHWTFVRLVYRMYADRSSGCLELRRGDAVKSVYFRRGRTQYIASNQHAELLGPFMVANGFISQADIDMAMARARSTGGRLGDLLIGLNLIKPFQLYQVLERQLRAKFIDAFGWDSGTYAFYPEAAPPGDIVPLDIDPMTVLAEGVRERVPLSVLEPLFGDKLDKPLYRNRNPLISVGTLRLQARESKALGMLLAHNTARPAYEECYGNRPQRLALLHVLFLMLQTDLLTFDAERA